MQVVGSISYHIFFPIALCFFKVPGLAPALLRILAVKAQSTRRIRQELGDIAAE